MYVLKFLSKVSPTLAAKISWPVFCTPYGKKKILSKTETSLLDLAQKTNISSGTYNISLYEWMPENFRENSSVILFTHGWGGRTFDFTRIIKKILKDGHTVIAFDSPAHGNSSGKRANIRLIAEALLAVSKKFDRVDVLISHSFGGMANAFAMSQAQGNKALSKVKKNIIISSPCDMLGVVENFTISMNLPLSVFKKLCARVEDLVEKPIESISISALLDKYTGQILVIHDHDDQVIKHSNSESIVKSTNSELFSTTGLGHGRILGSAAVAKKIVEFINT